MAKWVFYVLVLVYMCYRAVYGARVVDPSLSVEQIKYEEAGYLKVGTRKTVNCKASSKNQRLEWIDPFGNVVKRIPSSRVYTQEHFTSISKGNRLPSLVLTFSELLASDSGLYQCRSGDQKMTVPVCAIKPSEFVDSDDTPIEAGRSITLACQAKGDPEPTLVWSRNMEELAVYFTEGDEQQKYKVNRRYKTEGYESLLTITDVEPEDEGLYYCHAHQASPMLDNCTHTEIKNITLQVNYKPIFSHADDIKFVFGTNNEVVDIKCEARGWPKPTYRWFKDLGGGALYEFDNSKIIFSDEPNAAVLSVTAGPTTYTNTYKCTASNKFGETEKIFKLLRREKPRKVDNVEAISISKSQIIFNVTWIDDVNFPVDSLSIQYCPTYGNRDPDWTDVEEKENYINENEEGMIIKLLGLEPETEYFVRVRAANKAGKAPWSEAIPISTNDEDVTQTLPKTNDSEDSEDEPKASPEVVNDTGMFYGVFFTGAILITVVVCVFVMRLV